MATTTSSIIPYIRANEVEFSTGNLKPNKEAHFFFDSINVDAFIQRGSKLVANSGFDPSVFTKGEGLYDATTRGYATVITYSKTTPATIYLNDNYLSLNVNFFGSNVAFAQNDFVKGDIVFSGPSMSSNSALSHFTGRVEYFDRTNKVLVIKTISGTPNTSSSGNTLYNAGKLSGNLANVAAVVTNQKFGVSDTIISATDAAKTFTVGSYENNHGSIPTQSLSGSSTIALAITPRSTVYANTIYFTSGLGIAESRTVTAVSGSTITLNSPISYSGNTKYSFGTPKADTIGTLGGIFNIPETSAHKFKVGQRIFTITDSSSEENGADNQMRVTGEYNAAGLLNTVTPDPKAQPVVVERVTPVVVPQPVEVIPNRFTQPRRRGRDPVAQTFFTPDPKEDKNNYGIFVTSIDLFFKAKPDVNNNDPGLPVTVTIVKTLNGYPTQEIVAQTSVACSDVKTTNGTTTFPRSTDSTTYTKFTFRDPVYLLPAQEYAIVVYSDSPSYEVWISELGQPVLGDADNRRISEQPYSGSFFRSQNASTWTPFQNEDLMFVINKAVFESTAATNLVFKAVSPTSDIGVHSMMLHSSDITFPETTLSYGFRSTLASTLATEASYTNIDRDTLFNFSADLKTSSKTSNRKRIIKAGNSSSMLVQVSLETDNPDVSPIFNSERLSLITEEYLINDGAISNNNITIVNGGRHLNAANIIVTISAPQLPEGVTATANVKSSGLVANGATFLLTSLNITNPGSHYIESPTITITEVGATANATAVIVSEDGKTGGNALARYITKKIALADGFDAGDLRVFVDAIRPQGTHIIAYYKVLSNSDPDAFDDKPWVRMYLEQENFSLDTKSPVELKFRPAQNSTSLSYVKNNVTYPLGGKFKYFSIKLVMLASDPSVPPIVKNMRALALPGG